jgi:pectate lyase
VYEHTVLQNLDQEDVAIQADVRALSFDGTGRFVALMARYVDGANYYHAALRNTNRLELRKRINGVDSLIVSKAFTVAPNRNYRLRLEAIGGWREGKQLCARPGTGTP